MIKFSENTNIYNKTKQKQIIKTISPLAWNLVFYFLHMLYGFNEVMADKEFNKLFEELYKYVEIKISTPYKGEIKKVYVVVEQEK